MGFDLIGIKAKSKTGEYFRNNCWWWRPLAEYVIDNCPMPEEDKEQWGWNNGYAVSEETAIGIAKKLKELLKSGHTAKYSRKRKAELKKLPLLDCEYCEGTGNRKDMPDDEWKKKCGGCNACHGKGKVEQWACSYPFSVQNVRNFAKFCEDSGGFEIC